MQLMASAGYGAGSRAVGRKWRLRGFRPAPGAVIAALRRGDTAAYTEHNPRGREIRWIALFVTDDGVSTDDLRRVLGLRRRELRAFCAHWGVDYRRRAFAAGAAAVDTLG